MIDTVTFGAQVTDVSEGRATDGAVGPFGALTAATPGYSNQTQGTPLIQVSASVVNGSINIIWNAEPGVGYEVQYKNSLEEGWAKAGNATGGSFSQPVIGSHRFYRVIKP